MQYRAILFGAQQILCHIIWHGSQRPVGKACQYALYSFIATSVALGAHRAPWFNTRRYWQDRILELREQVALMDEPPLWQG